MSDLRITIVESDAEAVIDALDLAAQEMERAGMKGTASRISEYASVIEEARQAELNRQDLQARGA